MAKNKIIYNGNTLIDLTGDTVTADKLMQGYTAHDRSGAVITGTATGGGSVTQDQDGFIVLPPDGGGTPSGGLEYETGTWTPSENISVPTISFTNTHTDSPMLVLMSDASDAPTMETYTNYVFTYVDWYRLTGTGFPYSSTTDLRYGLVRSEVRNNNTTSTTNSASIFKYSSDQTGATIDYPQYFVTNEYFKPNSNNTSRYWRTGRTYKWIAVWAPTT